MFLCPVGGRVNGVPLYYPIKCTKHHLKLIQFHLAVQITIMDWNSLPNNTNYHNWLFFCRIFNYLFLFVSLYPCQAYISVDYTLHIICRPNFTVWTNDNKLLWITSHGPYSPFHCPTGCTCELRSLVQYDWQLEILKVTWFCSVENRINVSRGWDYNPTLKPWAYITS